MAKEREFAFENWQRDLEARLADFQSRPVQYKTREEYWMHQNALALDREVARLKKFGNPCRAPNCGLPLHLTDNFELYKTGPVCRSCFEIHSIISTRYFVNIQIEETLKKKDGGRNDKPGTGRAS